MGVLYQPAGRTGVGRVSRRTKGTKRGRHGRSEEGIRMSAKTWYKTQESSIEASYLQLMEEGVIEPLSRDEEESKQWNLRELASLLEGHFHEQIDISRLSDDERLAQ